MHHKPLMIDDIYGPHGPAGTSLWLTRLRLASAWQAQPPLHRFAERKYRKQLMIRVEVADRSSDGVDIESLFREGFLYHSYLCCRSRKGRRGVRSCAGR